MKNILLTVSAFASVALAAELTFVRLDTYGTDCSGDVSHQGRVLGLAHGCLVPQDRSATEPPPPARALVDGALPPPPHSVNFNCDDHAATFYRSPDCSGENPLHLTFTCRNPDETSTYWTPIDTAISTFVSAHPNMFDPTYMLDYLSQPYTQLDCFTVDTETVKVFLRKVYGDGTCAGQPIREELFIQDQCYTPNPRTGAGSMKVTVDEAGHPHLNLWATSTICEGVPDRALAPPAAPQGEATAENCQTSAGQGEDANQGDTLESVTSDPTSNTEAPTKKAGAYQIAALSASLASVLLTVAAIVM